MPPKNRTIWLNTPACHGNCNQGRRCNCVDPARMAMTQETLSPPIRMEDVARASARRVLMWALAVLQAVLNRRQ